MMSKDRSEMILRGNIAKAILTLALPIMASNLIQTFYNLTDTFFVSKLGTAQMAAMQITFPLIFLLISLGAGLSIGGIALISQYIGANDRRDARKIAGQLLTASMIASVAVAIVGYFSAESVLKLMNAEGDLLKYATSFLRIMFLGTPTMFITFAFNGIKQGEGNTFLPMVISSLSVFLNIALDPLFIFVFDMGIAGAAIATVLSRGVFNIVALYLLFSKKHNTLKLQFKDLKINKHYLEQIISVGMPAAFGQATTAMGFAVMNSFIISYGQSIVAAFAIGNRISSLIFMPAMGIAGALSTIIGQNIGAGNIKRANKAFLTSVGLASIIMSIGAIVMYFFTDQLVGLFTDDAYIISEGSYYLKMILITIPLFGFFNCINGLFQGSGHTISAMFINMGRLWLLRIPMILLLDYFNMHNSKYIWYAMILSNIIIVFVGLGLYLTGRWKQPVIKKKRKLAA
ncbi:MAG: MATE family efflux transporter [Clostridia bacterium]|nr:MATE family efflux transporter [Clostridia bacterium]